jgi:hypothetical protein
VGKCRTESAVRLRPSENFGKESGKRTGTIL